MKISANICASSDRPSIVARAMRTLESATMVMPNPRHDGGAQLLLVDHAVELSSWECSWCVGGRGTPDKRALKAPLSFLPRCGVPGTIPRPPPRCRPGAGIPQGQAVGPIHREAKWSLPWWPSWCFVGTELYQKPLDRESSRRAGKTKRMILFGPMALSCSTSRPVFCSTPVRFWVVGFRIPCYSQSPFNDK